MQRTLLKSLLKEKWQWCVINTYKIVLVRRDDKHVFLWGHVDVIINLFTEWSPTRSNTITGNSQGTLDGSLQ